MTTSRIEERLYPSKSILLVVVGFGLAVIMAVAIGIVIPIAHLATNLFIRGQDFQAASSSSTVLELCLDRNGIDMLMLEVSWLVFCVGVVRYKWRLPWSVLGFEKENLWRSVVVGVSIGLLTKLVCPQLYAGSVKCAAFLTPSVAKYMADALMAASEAQRPHDYSVMTVLSAVGVYPFVEEVLFRGLIYKALRSRYGIVSSMLVSSGLFTVLHFELCLMPLIFIWGCVAALLYERYRNIAVAISGHAAGNAVALVAWAMPF